MQSGGRKGGSGHKNLCMARVLSFLIRYFSNYFTLHRSDLAARAAPLGAEVGQVGVFRHRKYFFVSLSNISYFSFILSLHNFVDVLKLRIGAARYPAKFMKK